MSTMCVSLPALSSSNRALASNMTSPFVVFISPSTAVVGFGTQSCVCGLSLAMTTPSAVVECTHLATIFGPSLPEVPLSGGARFVPKCSLILGAIVSTPSASYGGHARVSNDGGFVRAIAGVEVPLGTFSVGGGKSFSHVAIF